MASNVLFADHGADPDDGMGFMSVGNTGYGGQQSGYSAAEMAPPETDEDYANEPPLLEELGIDFGHIMHKVGLVLNQAKPVEDTVLEDTDLAGPLVFAAAVGFFSLLAGKVNFGYIYGFGFTGCLALYAVINLMTSNTSIDLSRVFSALGYGLMPIVILSGVRVIVDLRGVFGLVLAAVVIAWSTSAATRIFVKYLKMQDQRFLLAYPILLLYSCFALIVSL